MKNIKKVISGILVFVITFSLVTFICAEGSGLEQEYNVKLGLYTQTFAGGRQFTSSVENGARVYDGVILNVPADISYTFNCDGKKATFHNGMPINDVGYYVLEVYADDVISGEKVSAIFNFRIMGATTATKYNDTYKCYQAECINTINNEENGFYSYIFPNFKRFYTSVPNYGAEVESGIFNFPLNVGYDVYKDGKKISIKNNQKITQAGVYRVVVYAKNFGCVDGLEAVYKTELNFKIPTLEIEKFDTKTAVVTETTTELTTAGVISDVLIENYNEEGKLYKQTFSTGNFFYTNISNNTLGGGNVYIDIPSNLGVSLLKDGLPYAFENKKPINEQGTYKLEVADNFNGQIYKAKFTFRIQNGVEKAENIGENYETFEDDLNIEEINESKEVVQKDYTYNSETQEFEIGDGALFTNIPPQMFSNVPFKFRTAKDAKISFLRNGEEYECEGDEISEVGDYEVIIEKENISFDFKLYDRAINTEESFSAPQGYKITDIEYEDYRNTYNLNEEETADEQTEEQTEETTVSLREVGLKGLKEIEKEKSKAVGKGIGTISFPIDGVYTLTLEGDDELPKLTTDIIIDRTVPEVVFDGLNEEMRSISNEIIATCDDEEATMILLKGNDDERLLSESGGAVKISGSGTYTLIVRDKAENENQYSFVIVRHIGTAGIGAIILFIMIIAGIIAFIIYNSKKFSVR